MFCTVCLQICQVGDVGRHRGILYAEQAGSTATPASSGTEVETNAGADNAWSKTIVC